MPLYNTNTALYTERKGCNKEFGMDKVFKGGGYGVTMQSLHNDANSGLGYLRPSRNSYSNCDIAQQKGGNRNLGLSHPSLAETRFNHESMASYGFNAKSIDDVKNFGGSYAPFTKNPSGQQCGGKRKSKRKSKKRKSKKRKSKRRKSNKRKSKKRKSNRRNSKRRVTKKRRMRKCICKRKQKYCTCNKKYKKRKSKKRNRSYKKRQRGGSSVFYTGVNSNVDNDSARLLRGDFKGSKDNCGDNYNHFNKSTADKSPLY